jgi:lipopolysaccharide/colanic/teichoic acid biosynthesis glycosyltransferase
VQARPGHNGKIFSLIKFKTMKDANDTDGNLLQDFERTTKLGNVLRKSSIDELPEIINIVLGHMSFVGPRPLLKEYLPLYSSQQKKRHNVKPGLTGLAQVNGRNQLSWEEKFRYDVEYAENVSFIMDLKIFIKTILIIFKINQVNQSGNIPMERFHGSKKKHKNY